MFPEMWRFPSVRCSFRVHRESVSENRRLQWLFWVQMFEWNVGQHKVFSSDEKEEPQGLFWVNVVATQQQRIITTGG